MGRSQTIATIMTILIIIFIFVFSISYGIAEYNKEIELDERCKNNGFSEYKLESGGLFGVTKHYCVKYNDNMIVDKIEISIYK